VIVDDYIKKTPTSQEYALRAARVLPDGISTDTRYFEPYGIYVDHALGSRKWDLDGNEYRDFFGGHGALMLGHSHPRVTQAIKTAADHGIQYAANHPLEVQWAEAIRAHIPTAELVRFAGSGTEATLLAIRVARAFTQRSKIIRISGHYHGWHDFAVSGYNDFFDGSPAPGVLPEIAQNTVLVPPNDVCALQEAIDTYRNDIAAILIEPLGMHFGIVPTSDSFLVDASTLARSSEIPVILDEVITAFRVGTSGMQGLLGLRPDLTCLGKVAAGGMPGGVLCGSARLMSVLSRNAQFEGGSRRKVLHQGTFTGNPLTASAAIATIGEVVEKDLCNRATEIGALVRAQLNEMFERADVSWRAYGRYSAFHIYPDSFEGEFERLHWKKFLDRSGPLLQVLRIALNLEGVDIGSRGTGYVSGIHDEDDVACLCDGFERAIDRLRHERILR
jgi:glutamate-1-semialdehyde 2,1-aminomutase